MLDLVVWTAELRIATMRERLRQAQESVRKYVPAGVSLADELSTERREQPSMNEVVSMRQRCLRLPAPDRGGEEKLTADLLGTLCRQHRQPCRCAIEAR